MKELRTHPLPTNDMHRVEALNALDLERRRGDPFFDLVTTEVRELFGTPIAFLSLMGEATQQLIHCNGADVEETTREQSLCAMTVAARETIVFPDTHEDPRTENHPMVKGQFMLRFSASAPVILSSGFCIGTLCTVDMVPHSPPTKEQVTRLERLAAMTARFYEAPAEPDAERARALGRIARAAQEEFLALVSHEMRTPLNGIVGLVDMLEPRDQDDADLLDAMRHSCAHLDRVVESVLQFTELNSGAIALDEGDADLAALVRRAIEAVRPMMKLRGKTFDLDALPESLPMRLDANQVLLMLGCIGMNFVLHGGDRGRVRLDRSADGQVLLVFDDNGPGIGEERLDRVFQAFGIGQEVNTRQADGMGLGLPLTRKIIEMHGGDILLYSGDVGLQVNLRLPAWRVI